MKEGEGGREIREVDGEGGTVGGTERRSELAKEGGTDGNKKEVGGRACMHACR